LLLSAGRKQIPRFTRNDKRKVVAGQELLLSAGRKQIPRFTRNDKREGGGRRDCFCPPAGSGFLASLGMTKPVLGMTKRGPNTGSFDCVNGLASESIHSAQDDRVRSGTEKNTGGWSSLWQTSRRLGKFGWSARCKSPPCLSKERRDKDGAPCAVMRNSGPASSVISLWRNLLPRTTGRCVRLCRCRRSPCRGRGCWRGVGETS
jgi:hypothetical protein